LVGTVPFDYSSSQSEESDAETNTCKAEIHFFVQGGEDSWMSGMVGNCMESISEGKRSRKKINYIKNKEEREKKK
jgi:hypothetical protein